MRRTRSVQADVVAVSFNASFEKTCSLQIAVFPHVPSITHLSMVQMDWQ